MVPLTHNTYWKLALLTPLSLLRFHDTGHLNYCRHSLRSHRDTNSVTYKRVLLADLQTSPDNPFNPFLPTFFEKPFTWRRVGFRRRVQSDCKSLVWTCAEYPRSRWGQSSRRRVNFWSGQRTGCSPWDAWFLVAMEYSWLQKKKERQLITRRFHKLARASSHVKNVFQLLTLRVSSAKVAKVLFRIGNRVLLPARFQKLQISLAMEFKLKDARSLFQLPPVPCRPPIERTRIWC